MIFNVLNPAQLSSALAGAHAGDTISLSAGDYGDVSILSKAFATDVTITSADPLHHAVFDSLSISRSSGIHVDGVDVHFTPDATTMSCHRDRPRYPPAASSPGRGPGAAGAGLTAGPRPR